MLIECTDKNYGTIHAYYFYYWKSIFFMPIVQTQLSLPARENFHQVIGYEETDVFYLVNKNNVRAAITNFGARLISLLIPVNDSQLNIVAGYNTLDQYLQSTEPYYGAVVGRYANRIAGGKMKIGDVLYQLPINDPPNHLHGGIKGLHKVVWDVLEANDHSVTFEYFSRDGEENYPGNVTITLTYTLSDDNELAFIVNATTDADTPVNIVNHAFFNLNGMGNGNILKHSLEINAGYFTPVNKFLIPDGQLMKVDDTPFDFRKPHEIGKFIFDDDIQLQLAKGYDHNYVLNKPEPFSFAAAATGDISLLKMEVFTLEPGMQLYTGNGMRGENLLSGMVRDEVFTAFCLETQHFPDSPNHPAFPSTLLKAGEFYSTRTVFKFTIPQE